MSFQPPPNSAAPPPMYFVPTPPRQRSLGAALFTVLMVTLLGCSLTLNFWLLVLGGVGAMWGRGGDADTSKRTVVVEGSASTKVYELTITGQIDDKTFERFDKLLKKAEADKTMKALIVHIDTPGGGVTASDNIYLRLLKFKETTKLPVVVTQGGFATSGGYYISAAADYILDGRTTWTGNIGVLMPSYNVSTLINKYGVFDNTLVSSGTPFKDAGSPTQEENATKRAYLQGLIDGAFVTFKDVVAKGRSGKLTQPIGTIANGKVYTAAEAKTLGLIDGIGDRADALAYLATTHGIASPEVIRLEEPATFSDLLGITTTLPGGETKLAIDKSALDPILSPRPMYLFREF